MNNIGVDENMLKALPPFMRDIEIIGNASEDIVKHKKENALCANQTIESELTVGNMPVLLATKEVKNIYVNHEFAKIKELETKAQQDLQPIYNNIAQNKINAWVRVKSAGKEFYMSWSANGSIWVTADQVQKDTLKQDDKSIQVVQVGTYSASSNILGVHSYNLSIGAIVTETAISFIVARALSQVIADGLGILVGNFMVYIANAAAEIGMEAFSCTISAGVVAGVATCLVFVVVFIGLAALWNWFNRKYTIRLQIFNWDEKNDWNVVQDYRSNAKVAGDSQDTISFTIPKKISAGSIVTPPGFKPVETLDSICNYGTIIWENDQTFMEGCSVALKMQKGNQNEGFMWALDCPRFSDNKQAGSNEYIDAKDYLEKGEWNNTPLNFEISATSEKIPVSFSLDALSGASDDLYNILININK